MTLATGAVLEDRYRIEQLLGQGGMGAVYRAYDVRLQQPVAIKENTMAVPGISPEVVEASRKQFEREALVLARLRHPNLARVIDHFVTPDGNQYLVMDYIEGQDLAHIIAHSGPLPEASAVAWISQACSALEYLHNQQPPIIHRDVKPQNIKVTPQGQVFLVDFGIAKVGGMGSKTSTGALGVTPGFSPPEQYAMAGTDARSDIYALGATLYSLLTGQVPPESILLQADEAQLVPPRQMNTSVSLVVQRAVLKAMQTRRTNRPQTVAEFRRMLGESGAKGVEHEASPPTVVVSSRAPGRPVALVTPGPGALPARPGRNLLPFVFAGTGVLAMVMVVFVVLAIRRTYSTGRDVRSSLTTELVPTATLRPTARPTGTATLAEVGAYDTPGNAYSVAVAGNYAYIADGDGGLRIVDVSDQTSPTEVSFYDTPGTASGVAVDGNYAYVADGSGGLQILDVANPAARSLVGLYGASGRAEDVWVVKNYAYVACGADGLHIVNISDPTRPTRVGIYNRPKYAKGVAIAGDYAYVADASSGLFVVDISHGVSPTGLGFYNAFGSAMKVAVAGNYAYIATGKSGLSISDIADPWHPAEAGLYRTPGGAWDVKVAGNYAYVADGDSGLQVFDISNLARLNQVGSYDTPGTAVGVAVTGNYAYIADGDKGLRIIQVR